MTKARVQCFLYTEKVFGRDKPQSRNSMGGSSSANVPHTENRYNKSRRSAHFLHMLIILNTQNRCAAQS